MTRARTGRVDGRVAVEFAIEPLLIPANPPMIPNPTRLTIPLVDTFSTRFGIHPASTPTDLAQFCKSDVARNGRVRDGEMRTTPPCNHANSRQRQHGFAR